MKESEYIEFDLTGLASLIRKKEVSAEEVLEVAIKRIERLDPSINSVCNRMFDEAKQQLRVANSNAPLFGVPFLLKDLRASYAGVPTTSGSPFVSHTPDFHSVVTQRYMDAGLIILGKTNVPELGLSIDTNNRIFGQTHNPWDLSRSAGGSSGGSAAAVAARLVPAAHASDGAGSIRVPAACCGVFGLKVSRSRVTYAPDSGEEIAGFSVQHAVTRSVRDSAILLDLVQAPVPGDPYVVPSPAKPYAESLSLNGRRLNIAFCTKSFTSAATHPECADAVRKTARLCGSLGHHVEEVQVEVGWDDGLGEAVQTIMAAGFLANVRAAAKLANKPVTKEDFYPAVFSFLRLGETITGPAYYAALKKVHAFGRMMASFHKKYDVLITPTLTSPPRLLSEIDYGASWDGNFQNSDFWSVGSFLPPFNASGQPAASIPLFTTDAGLPIGVQLISSFGTEDLLLALSAELEQRQPWAERIPSIAL